MVKCGFKHTFYYFSWIKSTLKPTFYYEKGGDFDFSHILRIKALGFASGFLLLQNVWKVKITPFLYYERLSKGMDPSSTTDQLSFVQKGA